MLPTISNHIPARGRKLDALLAEFRVHGVFQNHIPARGRKRDCQSLERICSHGFQNHIPARGRKHLLSDLILEISDDAISKPYPRKGAETFAPFKQPRADYSISKPYPRKGTERTSSLPCQSGGGGTRSVPEGAPWTQAVNHP